MKKHCLLFSLLFTPLFFLSAQEGDLLSLIDEEERTEYVTAAFKTNRVIHGHSIENTAGGVLDVKIAHRFGRLNTGFFEFYGLDNAMARIGADYGITDQLTVGLGRNGFLNTFDGFLKYKFLRQSTGKKNMPVSAALLGTLEFRATKENPDPEGQASSRFAYTYQLLVGRKFSQAFSLQLMPTLVHRNLVDFNEQNDVFAIGLGARQKITKRVALTLEYYYVPGDQLPSDDINRYYNSLAIGFDIETGGHVFQLHFTNSTSMIHRGFITETTGNWADGDIHFGFNIARVFTIDKPEIK
ncbi:MAG: hypothetical protein KDD10_28110 [Phaeodactylibacter sp.]|nr:hypothetical protein [Phaeodactylibacter sp.]MCB9296256.1 hypothetical protein [Lewinellaceae bacterium]